MAISELERVRELADVTARDTFLTTSDRISFGLRSKTLDAAIRLASVIDKAKGIPSHEVSSRARDARLIARQSLMHSFVRDDRFRPKVNMVLEAQREIDEMTIA
jgi:hypothetical protein